MFFDSVLMRSIPSMSGVVSCTGMFEDDSKVADARKPDRLPHRDQVSWKSICAPSLGYRKRLQR
jgi:hypothetical protein